MGRLYLLGDLFGKVVVPQAVWDELVLDGHLRSGSEDLLNASWIELRPVTTHASVVQVLRVSLDRGEAEAIALAQELQPAMLLIDEKLGREMAQHIGLPITGIVGVLIAVKRRRLDPDPAGIARQMRENGVWIAERLIQDIENA
ncbi:MAG: DUF3368 domain-containing protein [Verrucomicrobiaceae bacterium]|nr:DUF3368 domain-containing protein [Verrucomicrobiaceae bacterium]